MAWDWTRGYRQSFEFYRVDPATWLDAAPLTMVRSCKVTRSLSASLPESASFEMDDRIGGEAYIRVYMECESFSTGDKARECIGTFLVPRPDADMDGKTIGYSCDGYSPLKELDDDMPPVGYSTAAGADPVAEACRLASEHSRLAVSAASSGVRLSEPVTANDSDSWLDYIRALAAKGGHRIAQDARGRMLFVPERDVTSLRPSWTYRDDGRSIMLPDVSDEWDMGGACNRVEVTYTSDGSSMVGTAENDDGDSELSLPARGRTVLERAKSDLDSPTQEQLDAEALSKLKESSSIKRTISFRHAYTPTRPGDCVAIDYRRHAFAVRGRVSKQELACNTGLTVDEEITTTEVLFR